MKNVTVLKSPEEFAAMTSSEIVQFIKDNRNTAIVGDNLSEDRHIIRYKTRRDWLDYKNPFSNK